MQYQFAAARNLFPQSQLRATWLDPAHAQRRRPQRANTGAVPFLPWVSLSEIQLKLFLRNIIPQQPAEKVTGNNHGARAGLPLCGPGFFQHAASHRHE
jgi:hypothetical protein